MLNPLSVARFVGLLAVSFSAVSSAGVMVAPESVKFSYTAVVKVPKSAFQSDNFDFAIAPQTVENAAVRFENRTEVGVMLPDLEEAASVSFAAVGADGKLIHELASIKIADAPPPVPPTPPVPPVPPTPTRFGLTNAVAAWVTTSVDAPSRVKAKALASSFRAVISAIAAGAIVEPQKILSETRAANNAALGVYVEAWKPFGQKLSAELERLWTEKKLNTPADYAEAWSEIASALEKF